MKIKRGEMECDVGKSGCWMCKEDEYRILDKEVPVERILEEDKGYYIVIPRDPHIFGHVLIVLRKHLNSLTDATICDLNLLNEPLLKWSKILSNAFDDCKRVYLACLNDERHVHYHLFPVRDKEKPYCGCGLKWLGEREERSSKKPFKDCSKPEKVARGAYIKKMFEFLKDEAKKIESESKDFCI